MLELLRIRNLALIEDLELEFASGLNVLTGETGAGKSFILRAVGFLTGEKLSADVVRAGAEKAEVEALFVGEDGAETVVRRELLAGTGRSRVYVNDRLGSLEAVQALSAGLVSRTSQHAQQRLLSPAFQAGLLDGFVPDRDLLARRELLLKELRAAGVRRAEVEARCAELAGRRELLEFQRAEIDKVGPEANEEDELLAEREELRGSERARRALDSALDILSGGEGVADALQRLARDVRTLAEHSPDLADASASVDAMLTELTDLEPRLRRVRVSARSRDPETVERRLFELSQLRRKLGRDLSEIVRLRDEIEENLSFLDAAGLDLKRLAREEEQLAVRLRETLAALSAARREAAGRLESALAAELAQLGFSEHARVEIAFSPAEIYPGIEEERGRILWMPNPGQPAQDLSRIASGGELSRFLLALVSIMSEGERPTLIFDEVDAGVGGVTLTRVAERLESLAARQQVLVITHWPQIAARAARHFRVLKEVRGGMTYTSCQRLDEAEVFTELSRMAGGGEQGDALAHQLTGRA